MEVEFVSLADFVIFDRIIPNLYDYFDGRHQSYVYSLLQKLRIY